jgi:hypothetical protein
MAIVLATAAYLLVAFWRAQTGSVAPSHAAYAVQYPALVYALRALREGHGLLWNPLQNCGQPFLAATSAGLFYPPQLLLLVVDIASAFWVLAGVHVVLGGTGLLLLARQLDLRPAAALAGALAFGLGPTATGLAASLPTTVLGAYAWMPFALLLTERLLVRPTLWRGVGLGVVLSLQLFAAAPALLLCTALLVVLRVIWELRTARVAQPGRTLAALTVAALLPPLLGAVQLLPLLEWARQSGSGITLRHASPAFPAALTVVGAALASVTLIHREQRRPIPFYLLASGLLLVLRALVSLAPPAPGGVLAASVHVLWGAGCPLAVVVACGTDALLRADPVHARRGVALGTLAIAACVAFGWSPALRPVDVLLAVATLAACGAALAHGASRLVTGSLFALLLASLLQAATRHRQGLMPNTAALDARQKLFDSLRARTWPKWRADLVGASADDVGVAPGAASRFGVPAVGGDEAWTARRFVELTARMRQRGPEEGPQDPDASALVGNRPLLDLLATRFLAVDAAHPGSRTFLQEKPPLALAGLEPGAMLLQNDRALPRAFFVPHLEVVADPHALLERLASPEHDPRRVALIEQPPPDDFHGASGRVDIVADTSERLELSATTDRGGFVVVTDQYAPGWTVEIGGVPWGTFRANYAFRAVLVGPGKTKVVFSYRPRGVLWGTTFSAATLLVLAITGTIALDLRRHRRAAAAGVDAGWAPALRTADDVLLGTAVLLCGGMAVVVGLRLVFPCDLLLWPESPFMTNMMKLASGQPVFSEPTDLNSFIYAPGLVWVTYGLLAPFGLALDVRWARLVSVMLGLGAAACATAITATAMPHPSGPGVLRRCHVLGFAIAALLVLGNGTGDVPHPDNLHALHATATMLLCCLALRRGRIRLALAAVAVAGLGGLTKQPAALTVVGALVALLLGHRWGVRHAAALLGLGVAVAAASIAAMLGPANTRVFTLEVPSGHILEPDRIVTLLDTFSRGHQLLLLAIAPLGVAWLWHARACVGRQYLLTWVTLGAAGVLPALLAFFKFLGAANNLLGLVLWLFLVAWPWLAHGIGGEAVVPGLARRSAILLLLLSLTPIKSIPAADAYRYCHELIDRVGEDVRAGRRVLLGGGTTPLIRNGLLEPPRDRGNTMMEVAMAGRGDLLGPMQYRLKARTYDRIYANAWPEYLGWQLVEQYARIGSIAAAKRPALGRNVPLQWGLWLWLAYRQLVTVPIYAPKPLDAKEHKTPPAPQPPASAP